MLQGFLLGTVRITVSMVVNAAIIAAAGGIAVFLQQRPVWMEWQRWLTGALLGVVGIKLAIDAPAPATA